ncbi:hypothetical protein DPX16_3454 [Anabarilius grahami]|uniref:Uncharacterized protein n=1 Tax=Anabarilius grahami TaxID=495550 RepID=A0A3N0XKV7_ANAGA|nr:hypothetical protein DPX16_3454 [Anabarilius grahami]
MAGQTQGAQLITRAVLEELTRLVPAVLESWLSARVALEEQTRGVSTVQKSTLLEHCVVTDPKALEFLKRRVKDLLSERIILDHHEKLAVLLWPKFKQLRMFTNEEIYQSARSKLDRLPSPTDMVPFRIPVPDITITATECVAVAGPSVKLSQWEDVDDRDMWMS